MQNKIDFKGNDMNVITSVTSRPYRSLDLSALTYSLPTQLLCFRAPDSSVSRADLEPQSDSPKLLGWYPRVSLSSSTLPSFHELKTYMPSLVPPSAALHPAPHKPSPSHLIFSVAVHDSSLPLAPPQSKPQNNTLAVLFVPFLTSFQAFPAFQLELLRT